MAVYAASHTVRSLQEVARMVDLPDYLFVDGEPVRGTASLAVEDPADGSIIAELPAASEFQVRAAVDAAARSFGSWSTTPGWTRGEVLISVAQAIRACADELATV